MVIVLFFFAVRQKADRAAGRGRGCFFAVRVVGYGISPKRSASLLDTFSCIFQGIIPYGAQMLVAISTCAALGYAISAFDIIPLLFYPFLLCLSSLLFILFDKK